MTDNNNILGPSSSPDTAELTKALAKAQAEFKAVELDSSNPHFRSKFSSYATCCDSLRGPLTKNGLALPDFRPGLVGSQWVLVGTLRHSSGQYITGISPLVNPKGDMQGFGAAMTYAKRTLLMALTGGFSGEADDDGNSVQAAAASRPAPANSASSLAREQEWKSRIGNAKSEAEAKKVMAEVELRLREKAIDRAVFDRCKSEFVRLFSKEVTHG